MTSTLPEVRFNLADIQRAADEWGCNCGPAAVAGIAGLTLDEVRPHLGDFEQKRYTHPTLMLQVLIQVGANYSVKKLTNRNPGALAWPSFGLARIQWEGPWTAPGVPIRVRYRHTHWVGAVADLEHGHFIFDVNAMSVGGWISLKEWSEQLIPWLLRECEPKADGRWHLTHVIEVRR